MRKAGHMGSAQWLTDVECAHRLKSGGPAPFEHPSNVQGYLTRNTFSQPLPQLG